VKGCGELANVCAKEIRQHRKETCQAWKESLQAEILALNAYKLVIISIQNSLCCF